jgi:hypothetical protein
MATILTKFAKTYEKIRLMFADGCFDLVDCFRVRVSLQDIHVQVC